VHLGVDAALEEVGLGPWLVASFEKATGERAKLHHLPPLELVAAVKAGEIDEVLLGSQEAVEHLESEGLLADAKTVAHEELLLVGPRKNYLGKYVHTQGAELLRNVARTNYKYLEPAPDSVEGLRHARLFEATGDRVEPGAWFSTQLRGSDLVRAAIARDAFALVRRASLLLVAREGQLPGRVWAEGDPALVVEIVAGRVHAAKTERENRGLHAWLVGEGGAEVLRTFGEDRLGHPLYAPGAPPPGEGASTAPLDAWVEAARPSGETAPTE
jgi:tungstate transport system substrate-binding protein